MNIFYNKHRCKPPATKMPPPKNALAALEKAAEQKKKAAAAKAAGKEETRLRLEKEAVEAREKAEKEAAVAREKAEKDAVRVAAFWREMEEISKKGREHKNGYLGYLADKKKAEIGMYGEYYPTEAEMTVLHWPEEGYRMLERWNWLQHYERQYFDRMAMMFPA